MNWWSIVADALKAIQEAWKSYLKPVDLPKPVDTKPAKDLLKPEDK